jgi:hypothetical protein
MSAQQSLFDASNLAQVVMPSAPKLIPHTAWPYPGMTPVASAQAAMASTEDYHEMLAAVITARAGENLPTRHVLALVPQDWRELCGKYAHGSIASWVAKKHGIESTYVPHDGGGFHFAYMAKGGAV